MSDDRRPLISDSTLAEVAAMAERDRLAGGFPWEVPDHPDHDLPGGWHRNLGTAWPATTDIPQCPHCTSDRRGWRFVMPKDGGVARCDNAWHDEVAINHITSEES